jgi:hypothetical protein
MSALAMILSAALLGGNAPEKVSAEMQPPLDLRGEWEGTCGRGKPVFDVRLVHGTLWVVSGDMTRPWLPLRVIDDGNGHIRVGLGRNPLASGTYRRDKDRVTISFQIGREETPRVTLALRKLRK